MSVRLRTSDAALEAAPPPKIAGDEVPLAAEPGMKRGLLDAERREGVRGDADAVARGDRCAEGAESVRAEADESPSGED